MSDEWLSTPESDGWNCGEFKVSDGCGDSLCQMDGCGDSLMCQMAGCDHSLLS